MDDLGHGCVQQKWGAAAERGGLYPDAMYSFRIDRAAPQLLVSSVAAQEDAAQANQVLAYIIDDWKKMYDSFKLEWRAILMRAHGVPADSYCA